MIAIANACTVLRVMLAPLFAWSVAGADASGALALYNDQVGGTPEPFLASSLGARRPPPSQ